MGDLLRITDPQLWSWAMNVALLAILVQSLRHERKETVPRSVFETEQEQHAEHHRECREMLGTIQETGAEHGRTLAAILGILKAGR